MMPMTTRNLPLVLLLMMVIVSTISFLRVQEAKATPDIIFSDSEDGYVTGTGLVGNGMSSMLVGDSFGDISDHMFVRFSLSSVWGNLTSAKLYLYLFRSRTGGIPYETSPLPNIGLGDCQVIHIADYGTLDGSDFNAPSIGNDPGVLIGSSATPDVGFVSIDVKAAMEDDMRSGRSFTAFMLKMSTATDNDQDQDTWHFRTFEHNDQSQRPYIDYTSDKRPVGGVVVSTSKLEILAPYLALVGLIAAVSAVVAVKKRR